MTTATDVDLEIEADQPDPFMDECPRWCESVGRPHPIEGHECDRSHYGQVVRVPLRNLSAHYCLSDDYGPARYELAHAEMYLRRPPLHREAQVQVNLNATNVGALLTLVEAEQIGRALLVMVEAAR